MSTSPRSPSNVRHGARRILVSLSVAAAAIVSAFPWSAAATDFSFGITPDVPVPDGNASGLASGLVVPPLDGPLADVNVTVDLVSRGFGGWNGDLYAYLMHDGVMSVLVNRPGMAPDRPFGYGDNGLASVLFDDETPGDFHRYQFELGAPGDTDLPIGGTWQPDARGTDPNDVLDADPRSLFLGGFDGMDGSGPWWLYVADLSPGGAFTLKHWQLDLVTNAEIVIPEPGTGIAAAGALTAALALGRWFARRRKQTS